MMLDWQNIANIVSLGGGCLLVGGLIGYGIGERMPPADDRERRHGLLLVDMIETLRFRRRVVGTLGTVKTARAWSDGSGQWTLTLEQVEQPQ